MTVAIPQQPQPMPITSNNNNNNKDDDTGKDDVDSEDDSVRNLFCQHLDCVPPVLQIIRIVTKENAVSSSPVLGIVCSFMMISAIVFFFVSLFQQQEEEDDNDNDNDNPQQQQQQQ